MERPPERPQLTVACLACEGQGHTVHPTATAGGSTAAIPRTCSVCDGTGRRSGFRPSV